MNRLDGIIADTKTALVHHKNMRSLNDCDRIAREQQSPRGFGAALAKKAADGGMALIAEIKRASPSRGVIRTNFDPAHHAQAYADGGAACLSILTDRQHFQGANDHLIAAHTACDLPILRKDFIVDPWQIAESRAIGADAILLIAAVLDNQQMAELESAAVERTMDVLVEIHDSHELERALAYVQSPLIGINNRNLKDFTTDLSTCERLARLLPKGRVAIGESAIRNHSDCLRLYESGIQRFLVGESLMQQKDLARAVRLLLQGNETGEDLLENHRLEK